MGRADFFDDRYQVPDSWALWQIHVWNLAEQELLVLNDYARERNIIKLRRGGFLVNGFRNNLNKCPVCGFHYGRIIVSLYKNGCQNSWVQCPRCKARTVEYLHSQRDWTRGYAWRINDKGYPVFDNGHIVTLDDRLNAGACRLV